MPDSDIIRGLGRLYQNPYKVLREGKATSEECARGVIKALKKDLQQKGDVPIVLSKEMGNSLDKALGSMKQNNPVEKRLSSTPVRASLTLENAQSRYGVVGLMA